MYIIDGYRAKKGELEAERYDNGWRFVSEPKPGGGFDLRIDNSKPGERVPIPGNKRMRVLGQTGCFAPGG